MTLPLACSASVGFRRLPSASASLHVQVHGSLHLRSKRTFTRAVRLGAKGRRRRPTLRFCCELVMLHVLPGRRARIGANGKSRGSGWERARFGRPCTGLAHARCGRTPGHLLWHSATPDCLPFCSVPLSQMVDNGDVNNGAGNACQLLPRYSSDAPDPPAAKEAVTEVHAVYSIAPELKAKKLALLGEVGGELRHSDDLSHLTDAQRAAQGKEEDDGFCKKRRPPPLPHVKSNRHAYTVACAGAKTEAANGKVKPIGCKTKYRPLVLRILTISAPRVLPKSPTTCNTRCFGTIAAGFSTPQTTLKRMQDGVKWIKKRAAWRCKSAATKKGRGGERKRKGSACHLMGYRAHQGTRFHAR